MFAENVTSADGAHVFTNDPVWPVQNQESPTLLPTTTTNHGATLDTTIEGTIHGTTANASVAANNFSHEVNGEYFTSAINITMADADFSFASLQNTVDSSSAIQEEDIAPSKKENDNA